MSRNMIIKQYTEIFLHFVPIRLHNYDSIYKKKCVYYTGLIFVFFSYSRIDICYRLSIISYLSRTEAIISHTYPCYLKAIFFCIILLCTSKDLFFYLLIVQNCGEVCINLEEFK